jgi:hypothetical protein
VKSFSIVSFSLALFIGTVVAAQSKPTSIQGVWQVVEVTTTGPDARKITQVPGNLTIITARHYSRVEVHTDQPRQQPADVSRASADELRAVWGPFVGEAGTYEVTGTHVVTLRPIVSKNPLAMSRGSFSTFSYKLDGDTLWITEQSTQNGPVANPATIKAVRIE